METTDISRSIVIMLVIVSVVISLLGTWTVLEEAKRLSAPSAPLPSEVKGQVSITVTEPPVGAMAQATGRVSLNIVKR
jgi:hypothetical protein